MLGRLSSKYRFALVTVGALLCPHPVSFREGGYLPLLSLVTDSFRYLDVGVMVAGCLVVYGLLLYAVSFLFFES